MSEIISNAIKWRILFSFANVFSTDNLCKHFSSGPVTFRGQGAQWLRGRVLDSRPRGRGFKSHRRHCVLSLSKNINPSLVLVQSRKTRPFITERLLMGRKESNQTNKIPSMDGIVSHTEGRLLVRAVILHI